MRSLPRAWSPLRVDVRATRRLLYSSIGNSIPSATFRIPKLAPSISTEEKTTVASLSSPPSTPVQPSILFQPSSSPSKGSSLSFRIPKPPPPSLVLPSTKPAPAPAFKLKLPISISHIPFVARKPTSHPPMFPRQDDPLAGGDALERANWVAVPGGRRGPLFRKTFKLLGADFRSGVMSRFARYLKLWPSFPSGLIHTLSLSTSSASVTLTLDPSVASSSSTSKLLRLLDLAIDHEERDKAGSWYATGVQQLDLKELGWKRVWRVKEDGWVKENGERERERVLERTFDFQGKEDGWKLMRKTSGRLHRVFVDVGWRGRMMGMSDEPDFDLLIYPLPPMDFPCLLTVQLSPLRSSPPLSLLASSTKAHPFPRLPFYLRVAAKGVENLVAAQSLGAPEETEASRTRLREAVDRILQLDAAEGGERTRTRLATDEEQRELREVGWRKVWREKEGQEEGEEEGEKESALERTFDFEGEEDEWGLIEKAESRLKRLFLEPEFRMSMGMTHQPNFTLLLLPLPSSSSSSSSPSLTIQLTPAPSSPPLSLLTPLNTSNLFHRLPVSMLSAANIVSHLVENTRIGTAVQYAERRIREFARLSAEADPEFWAGTRESAEEVMGSLVGGGGGKLEEGELGTYRKREVGKGNKGKLSSSSSSIPSEDKDKDDKEDDGSSFEADFLATATASSSPFPPLSSSSISPTTPTSTERTNLSFLFKTRTRTTTTSSSSFDDDDNSFWTLPSTSDVQENNPFRPNWIGSKPLQPMFRLPQGSLPDALDEGEEELEEEEEEGMVKLGTEEELEVEVREGGKGKVVMDPERELRQLMDLVKAGRGGRG